ncbi:glycosyltransferase family 9 protein [Ramlibacter sp.]|uniref:glycosyltransferase family 9 protein n=1 Tax=Ramlibacter sp. TaxID=1917967 RepID=UPI002CB3A77F|nr:glycosyltransferase family 9 protein [Ramlibacter sp.]HWI84629.1 glycosyltransferase family 9 protein [Ramlibacter sp.]
MTAPPTAAASVDRGPPAAWQLLLTLTLAGLGFFLPFSSAGVAIMETALLLLIAARPRAIVQPAVWRHPVMAVGLALLAYIALHTLLVSGTGRPTVRAINQYQELLLAPLLMALLQRARDRLVLVRALILGATVLALVYWAALFAPQIKDQVLHERRISAGFALSICAFLLLLRAQGHRHAWWLRGAAAFFALSVMFAISARTGHLLLLVLAACAAWLYAPRGWRWAAAVACPLLVLALALSSDAVETRMKETLAGSQPASASGEFTSTTIRIELIRISAGLMRSYGLAGAGYANYETVHQQAARERYPELSPAEVQRRALWMRSSNPHNEYAMHLISGGAIALALFIAWLGLTVREAWRARPPVAGILGGLTLAFAVGCLFNSLLMDFVEGHLYVALLACLLAEARDRSPRQENIQRVLVIVTRQIGDVLLATPLLRAARRRWPQAELHVLAFSGTAGMLRGNGDVDLILEYPARLGWRGLQAAVRRLWRRYDLALVADPGDRAHLLGWVAAPRRSGIVPARGGSNWLKRLSLDHAVVSQGDLGDVHVTAEKTALLAPWLRAGAGVAQVVPPPASPLAPALRAQVRPGAVVVHAPSMWPYKQWPIAHFERLVAALLARGRQVILTGSGSGRDQECIAPLRRLGAAPQLLDLSGQLDFSQLSGLLQEAALYIGPDTSVSHLAAATGVPVIAIFGPTNPMRWAPWPARAQAQALFARSAAVQRAGNVTLLQGTQPCVPCGRAGCEDHRLSRSDCLQSITPEQVLAEVQRILAA